jgi:hypothetical protein
MRMYRVIHAWMIALAIVPLAACMFIVGATATKGPPEPRPDLRPQSTSVVQADRYGQRWPDGWHTYDCRTMRSGLNCSVYVLGPPGVQAESSADWAVEVILDGRVQAEHFDCGPLDEDRAARCVYTLRGSIFQGGLVTTTFTLANGQQRTLSYRNRCNIATPDGQVCRNY